ERGELEKAAQQAFDCSARAEGLGAYACVVAANVMFGSATMAKDDASSAKLPLERGDELAMVTNMAPFRTLTKGLLASSYAQLGRSEEHTSELQSRFDLVCRLLLEK